MTKFIYSLIFLFPFVLISCSDDDNNNEDNPQNKNRLSVTYKATSKPEGKTFLMISYNVTQYIFFLNFHIQMLLHF